MPWVVAAAGVTAAAGLAGSAMQSSAAGSAADKANAAQRDALAQQTAQLAPWTGTGGSANTATADLLGLNGPDAATTARSNFQASPGYQWSLDQGLRAVDAGAASKGLLRSGATLKAEQTFGTGLADQEFSQYYNNLFNLSKLGESAGAGTGAADIATGHDIAGTDVSTGAQLSSIYGNEAKGLSSSVNTLFNNPQFQTWAKGLGTTNTPGVSGSPSTPSIYGVPSPYG